MVGRAFSLTSEQYPTLKIATNSQANRLHRESTVLNNRSVKEKVKAYAYFLKPNIVAGDHKKLSLIYISKHTFNNDVPCELRLVMK